MAVPFSNTKLRVPKGFQNILECLAREVLRSQPSNIHEFAAVYFEKLMKVRSETGHDPAIHGAKLEDRNYNNESFKKRSVDPSDPQQNQAALAIQTQFRQHSAKQEVASMKEELAATRIQAGVRGYLDREQVREMKSNQEDGAKEEVDIDLDDPDVEEAAIKIQAGFKGFKARKEIQEQAQGSTQPEEEVELTETPKETEGEKEEEVDIDLSDPDVEKAAVKIQAGFKGFKTRQALRDDQEAQSSPPEAEQTETGETQAEGEEEVDIDLNDPDTQKAAIKIQAGFRGYQTRKDLKDQTETTSEAVAEESQPAEAGADQEEEIDIDLTDPEVEKAATKIQAGFKGFKARKEAQSVKETDEGDQVDAAPEAVPPEDSSAQPGGDAPPAEGEDQTDQAVPEAAATEEDKAEEAAPEGEGQTESAPAEEEPTQAMEEESAPAAEEGREADIDVEGSDVHAAAVKIQAGFKGMKARREVKILLTEKSEKSSEVVDEGEREQTEASQEEQEGQKETIAEEGGEENDEAKEEQVENETVTETGNEQETKENEEVTEKEEAEQEKAESEDKEES